MILTDIDGRSVMVNPEKILMAKIVENKDPRYTFNFVTRVLMDVHEGHLYVDVTDLPEIVEARCK